MKVITWASGVVHPEDKGILLKDVLDIRSKNEELLFREKSKTIRVGGRESIPCSKQEWDNVYINDAIRGGHQRNKIATGDLTWRKLTPSECERLQTFPDNYTGCVSNNQRYKCLGNGFTVDIISHLLRNILL